MTDRNFSLDGKYMRPEGRVALTIAPHRAHRGGGPLVVQADGLQGRVRGGAVAGDFPERRGCESRSVTPLAAW